MCTPRSTTVNISFLREELYVNMTQKFSGFFLTSETYPRSSSWYNKRVYSWRGTGRWKILFVIKTATGWTFSSALPKFGIGKIDEKYFRSIGIHLQNDFSSSWQHCRWLLYNMERLNVRIPIKFRTCRTIHGYTNSFWDTLLIKNVMNNS